MTELEKKIKAVIDEYIETLIPPKDPYRILRKKTDKFLKSICLEDDSNVDVRRIKDLIKSFPDDEFDVIDMKYFQKMTEEAIAEFLGISTRTVSRWKNNALERLSFSLFTNEALDILREA